MKDRTGQEWERGREEEEENGGETERFAARYKPI